jgi:hypothetical protein
MTAWLDAINSRDKTPENTASSASRPVPLLQSAPSRPGGGMFPDMHYRQSSKRRVFC